MSDHIYPDLSNDRHDIQYGRGMLLTTDIIKPKKVLTKSSNIDVDNTPGFKLLDRFRVGDTDKLQPGDIYYVNAGLIDCDFMLLIGGLPIHQLTGDDTERYCTKSYESDTIFINNGVSANEPIEIYIILGRPIENTFEL